MAEPDEDASRAGHTQELLGWIGIGVGGVGLAVGAVTGILVGTKRSALLDDGCKGTHCSPSQRSDVDSYNSLRQVSTISFMAGGVIGVAGVTLLLTAPKQESERPMALRFGPGSVLLEGGFWCGCATKGPFCWFSGSLPVSIPRWIRT